MVDYFAATGCAQPTSGTATYPQSSYFSATDTTWYTWEAGGLDRIVQVKTYNHAPEEWSETYTVGDNPLRNDSHGLPAIERDHEGYIHCFFGSHVTPLKYAHTTNPDDPSAWAQGSDIGSVTTYPKPILVGSTLWLFYRKNNGEPRPITFQKTTALKGGAATWSSDSEIISWDGSRCYAGNFIKRGTELHFMVVRAPEADTYRRDLFYYIYDTADGSLSNIDGSVSVASGSLPVNLTMS